MRRIVLPAIASAGVVALALQATGGGGEPPAEAARMSALTPLQQRLMSGFALDRFQGPDSTRLRSSAGARTPARAAARATSGGTCASTRTART